MVSCALRGAPHAQQSNLSERSKTDDFFYLWGVFLGTTGQSGAPLCACRLVNVAHTGVDKLCLQFDVFPCVYPPEEYSGILAVPKCARTHTLEGILAQREVRSEAPPCVRKGAQREPGATREPKKDPRGA